MNGTFRGGSRTAAADTSFGLCADSRLGYRTYGYSFGDDHINRIIRDMLTIPSTHLVIISYGDESGRINTLYNSWGRQSQISLLIGKDLADLSELVNFYLPKPAIDRSSIRMADILRQRFTQISETKNGETKE